MPKPLNPKAEAEATAEAIDISADRFDPPDRAAFYRRLAELVTAQRDELETFIHGDDRKPN